MKTLHSRQVCKLFLLTFVPNLLDVKFKSFRRWTMTEPEEKLIRTLLAIAQRHNKGYVYASQPTLQFLLAKYQEWNFSERTVRRRLKDLEAKGFIKIVHRNWSEVNGSKKYRCNLYRFTRKLFEWLEKVERFVRKAFSFFHRPKMAIYSSKPLRRDLEKPYGNVEILWKSPPERRLKPSQEFM